MKPNNRGKADEYTVMLIASIVMIACVAAFVLFVIFFFRPDAEPVRTEATAGVGVADSETETILTEITDERSNSLQIRRDRLKGC